MPISFVYFDIGGVLLNWEKALVKIAHEHGKKEVDVWNVFRKYDAEFCRGSVSEADMKQILIEELALPDSLKFDFHEFVITRFEKIEPMHKLLHEVKKKYKIGLLTNLHKGSFEKIVKKKQIPDVDYHAIIKSYEVGYIKPEPEIYHVAQKKSGHEAREILFIDDLPQNVHTATKLGWNALQFEEKETEKSITRIKKLLQIK